MSQESVQAMSEHLTHQQMDRRITIVETKMEVVEKQIDTTSTTLATLETKVDTIKDRINFWGGGLAVLTFLSPILVAIVLHYWK
jgi:hypothetical protein